MLYCIFKELQTLNAKSLNDDFVLMPKKTVFECEDEYIRHVHMITRVAGILSVQSL